MAREPKIMVYDVETMYAVAPVWGLWDQNIQHTNLISEPYMVCAAWKYLGKKRMYSTTVTAEDPHNDKDILMELADAFNDCDAVITHNGNSFDHKVVNTRLAKHGLPPLDMKKPSIDTCVQAKTSLKLISNKLDYVGEFFGVGRKIPTNFELWNGCYRGEKKALKEMLEYNKQDVLLLEDVYLKMRPYMKNHPNFNMFIDGDGHSCTKCSSTNVKKRGIRVTITQQYQRYQCYDCGSWSNGKPSITPEEKKKDILK